MDTYKQEYIGVVLEKDGLYWGHSEYCPVDDMFGSLKNAKIGELEHVTSPDLMESKEYYKSKIIGSNLVKVKVTRTIETLEG